MSLSIGQRAQRLLALQNLPHARQKDQHMPVGGGERFRHRGSRYFHRVALVAPLLMMHRHRKQPPLCRHHRAAPRPPFSQQLRHRFGLQRGTHHDDPQIGPDRLSHPYEQAEHQIHLERALVKLIQHDRADPLQADALGEPPQHDAGRLHDQPRVAPHAGVEPYLIPRPSPHFSAPQPGDLLGHRAGGQAPGLHEDQPLPCRKIVADRRWHEHRFARSRRRRDNHRAAA